MKIVELGPQTLLYPMPAVLVGAQVKGKPTSVLRACTLTPAVALKPIY